MSAGETLRSFLRKRGWIGGLAALAGGGLFFLAYVTTITKHPNGVIGTRHFDGWRIAVIIVALAMMFIGLLLFSTWSSIRNDSANQRVARVKKLSDALDEALRTISSVRGEVEEGQLILARIQSEIAVSKDLARLTSDQSKAVEDLVRKELRRERWPSLWVQFVVGLLLIGVGILISHL